MRHIVFASSWTGTGTEASPNRPLALTVWRANGIQFRNLRDVGQPNVLPDPNLCVWECDAVDDAGVTLLEADPANYVILLDEAVGAPELGILAGSDKPKDEKPDAQTKTNLETFLKTKGVKNADAANLCKKADNGATRKGIADGVIAYCRALPKKK